MSDVANALNAPVILTSLTIAWLYWNRALWLVQEGVATMEREVVAVMVGLGLVFATLALLSAYLLYGHLTGHPPMIPPPVAAVFSIGVLAAGGLVLYAYWELIDRFRRGVLYWVASTGAAFVLGLAVL